jgi:hypothetical protein
MQSEIVPKDHHKPGTYLELLAIISVASGVRYSEAIQA